MGYKMNAGYSQRPLIQKLGIKPGAQIAILNAPETYAALLGPLPPGVVRQPRLVEGLDFIHFFTKSADELKSQFPQLKAALAKNGMLWISWPKKSSKVVTDLDENLIRDFGLAEGLVDVKVAAIDSIWSGLKFVYRVRDR